VKGDELYEQMSIVQNFWKNPVFFKL